MIETHHFMSVDSTNEEAKRRLKEINPNEDYVLVITADTQTKGKGQKNRVWHSESDGGLYYTCAFTPKTLTVHDLEHLSVKVGEKIVDKLNNECQLGLTLEWPNDMILDDKKCGGILIESISKSNQEVPDYVIVGIGFNVNQTTFPDHLKAIAISLRQKNQKVYNKDTFKDLFTQELIACR
jgi:BirA family biotin operon repressor/biotin-[acetyl-CoA-carboxylase] ligase